VKAFSGVVADITEMVENWLNDVLDAWTGPRTLKSRGCLDKLPIVLSRPWTMAQLVVPAISLIGMNWTSFDILTKGVFKLRMSVCGNRGL
jgi:hypothetical protein